MSQKNGVCRLLVPPGSNRKKGFLNLIAEYWWKVVLLLSKTTRIWKQNKWCQFLESGKNSIIFFDLLYYNANEQFLELKLHGLIWTLYVVEFDLEIRISDFAIEREIRKQISPPRNPSSGWISIKKSKSGFHGFPFYRLIGKSVKGFAKLFSWTTVLFLLIMRTRARTLFLRAVFRILFRISQSNGKKEIQKLISQRWNPVLDFAFYCKSEIRILKSKSRFPNRTPAPYIEKTWYKIPS